MRMPTNPVCGYCGKAHVKLSRCSRRLDGFESYRFDEFLWRLKTIAGRLGMQRLSLWARAWWRWRTNYEPFGRRRSRGGPPDGPFVGEGEDEGDFF